ncbi:MAG: hypothetical protein H6622_04575 [Halobacteriovoraceae bacterium]|nr:hypothetical protein [Halobacteriovoraceae bacterium]
MRQYAVFIIFICTSLTLHAYESASSFFERLNREYLFDETYSQKSMMQFQNFLDLKTQEQISSEINTNINITPIIQIEFIEIIDHMLNIIKRESSFLNLKTSQGRKKIKAYATHETFLYKILKEIVLINNPEVIRYIFENNFLVLKLSHVIRFIDHERYDNLLWDFLLKEGAAKDIFQNQFQSTPSILKFIQENKLPPSIKHQGYVLKLISSYPESNLVDVLMNKILNKEFILDFNSSYIRQHSLQTIKHMLTFTSEHNSPEALKHATELLELFLQSDINLTQLKNKILLLEIYFQLKSSPKSISLKNQLIYILQQELTDNYHLQKKTIELSNQYSEYNNFLESDPLAKKIINSGFQKIQFLLLEYAILTQQSHIEFIKKYEEHYGIKDFINHHVNQVISKGKLDDFSHVSKELSDTSILLERNINQFVFSLKILEQLARLKYIRIPQLRYGLLHFLEQNIDLTQKENRYYFRPLLNTYINIASNLLKNSNKISKYERLVLQNLLNDVPKELRKLIKKRAQNNVSLLKKVKIFCEMYFIRSF